jgi:hypothetical protein
MIRWFENEKLKLKKWFTKFKNGNYFLRLNFCGQINNIICLTIIFSRTKNKKKKKKKKKKKIETNGVLKLQSTHVWTMLYAYTLVG